MQSVETASKQQNANTSALEGLEAHVETEYVPCSLCGSTRTREVAIGTDREYPTSSDEFHIVECCDCGLHYLNPRPTAAELARIYPSNYYAYNYRPAGQARKALPLVTRIRHRLFATRFTEVLRRVADRPSIELLDVGCGDGWMLDLYKRADPARINTFGVDFNEAACDVARQQGHTVYCSRFEDLHISGRFDIVNLSQVIEHVSDPLAVARKSFEVLRPGGLFVVETPNTDTWDYRRFSRGAWGAYHIPRHWNLFDPASIQRLGETAGFRLRTIVFNPAAVHWVWTFHNLTVTREDWIGRLGRRVFAPLDVFNGSPKTFVMLAAGTLGDLTLRALTGRTSNMMAIFEKEISS